MSENNAAPLDASAYMSWIEVDLGAIRWNYRQLRNALPPAVEIFPVIKADAYGHGAAKVAHLLEQEGARRLCVARVEEAVALRRSGTKSKILVFCPPLPAQAILAAQHDLECVVCDMVHIEAIAAAQAQSGKAIQVHVKTDVGMGRLGVRPGDVAEIVASCRERSINVCGVMSHFPCADTCDKSATEAMADRFRDICQSIVGKFPDQKFIFHIANSAGAMRIPDGWFNAVRVGISLYGQYPSVEIERTFDLKPAMNLKTRIIYVKEVPAGTPISYCHTYRAPVDARLATIALGYADGYPRHASNKTEFLVHGKLAPQVGRVCMDQLVIDVTEIPEAKIGDEVLAFGCSGGQCLLAEEVAARFDSIGYELTTRIGKRLPRFFLDNGSVTVESNAL